MASKAAKAAKPGDNAPPPKIIVKKVYIEGHGGHHGGAWKVAYADFVTAMMAFFLLMWLLGATTEKQRKALADYFTPTLVQTKENSAGSHGLFGGESIIDKDSYPHKAQQTGTRSLTIPMDASGGAKEGSGDKGSLRSKMIAAADKKSFDSLKAALEQKLATDGQLKAIRDQVHFTQTKDGLQIDLLDRADFSMFALGTTMLVPRADELVATIGRSLAGMPNKVTVRGHTDSLPYGDPRLMNNWMLSTGRAEATRRRLAASGVGNDRFERIEGVADRDPYVSGNAADPRNRRVTITLLYRQ